MAIRMAFRFCDYRSIFFREMTTFGERENSMFFLPFIFCRKEKRSFSNETELSKRNQSQYHIKKGVTLMSNEVLTIDQRQGKLPLVLFKHDRPLVLLLTWLSAKPKLVKKYANLYLSNGFDVLAVSITPWQLLKPTKGARVSATQAIDFLNINRNFRPLFVHCFSVGGFVWIEQLIKMKSEINKYKSTVDRIKGQIFESPPGPPPFLEDGFAQAFFPKNALMREVLAKSVSLYLNTFHFALSKTAFEISEAYFRPPIQLPTTLLLSKADLVSPIDFHMKAYKCWKSQGINAQIKCWENAPHVGILWTNREEYIEQINKFIK